MYDSANFVHIVGADEARTSFRLLAFDRQRPSLAFSDEERAMTAAELTERLAVLRDAQRGWRWLTEAYAILGVIALLQVRAYSHYLHSRDARARLRLMRIRMRCRRGTTWLW